MPVAELGGDLLARLHFHTLSIREADVAEGAFKIATPYGFDDDEDGGDQSPFSSSY